MLTTGSISFCKMLETRMIRAFFLWSSHSIENRILYWNGFCRHISVNESCTIYRDWSKCWNPERKKNYISNTKITCLCIANWPQNIRLLILIPNKRICSAKCSRSLRIISHTIYHFRFKLESHIAAFRRSGHPPTLLTRWSLDLRWSPGAIGVVRSGLWRGARGGWEELAARTRKEDSKLVSPVRAFT